MPSGTDLRTDRDAMRNTIIVTTILSVAAFGVVFSAGVIVGTTLVANDLAIMNRLNQLVQTGGREAAAADSIAEIEAAIARLGAIPGSQPSLANSGGARVAVQLDNAPIRGAIDATVTIVEFADFQCPYCAKVTPALTRLLDDYPDDVRLAFKHLPLPMHDNAEPAARAALAAQLQGSFWKMHDLLFSNQAPLDRANYIAYAEILGLDLQKFVADMDSDAVGERISVDVNEADRLGVSGTPGFFINGRYVSGAIPYEDFKRMIDAELAGHPRG